MPDNESIPMQLPTVDLIKKWGPDKDPNADDPDEIKVVEGFSDVPGSIAQAWRAHDRRVRTLQMLGIATAVGVCVVRAWFGLGRPNVMAGGLATIGAAVIADALIGGGTYTVFNNANAYLAVGDSNTAFATGQTDLQAASNKLRKAMDATYPSRSSNVITFRSTFGSSEGNFAWEENGVFNHASAGQMLVRKVVSLGTKVSGATWEFTKTVTITAG